MQKLIFAIKERNKSCIINSKKKVLSVLHAQG